MAFAAGRQQNAAQRRIAIDIDRALQQTPVIADDVAK